ncbi:MAG: DUF302 domain-containing protein [Candidatus Eisenbacteria bacterium]|nr:DUF302 domain-containing protein [Candidatus Eisenbacteria bacterium]
MGFDEALAKLPEALKSEGFGVLTEIDVQKTLKDKLDVAFRRYRIVGACNPPLAHRALQAELEIGLMLPCNLVVYEGADGKSVVAAMDPVRTLASIGLPALAPIAEEVRARLGRVLERLG